MEGNRPTLFQLDELVGLFLHIPEESFRDTWHVFFYGPDVLSMTEQTLS